METKQKDMSFICDRFMIFLLLMSFTVSLLSSIIYHLIALLGILFYVSSRVSMFSNSLAHLHIAHTHPIYVLLSHRVLRISKTYIHERSIHPYPIPV